MASFPWNAVRTTANIAGTTLNSLADPALSAVMTELANGTNLDKWCVLEINLGSINPTGTPILEVYMTQDPSGGSYEDAPVIGGANTNTLIDKVPVSTGSSAKRVFTLKFLLPPYDVSFYIGNQLNVAMASTGNTVIPHSWVEGYTA